MIKTIDPKLVSVKEFHSYFLGAVAPRPIAFASTVDKNGNINLSPFSFFNVFGSNPPVLIFSPSRRVRDNTNKHTLENVLEHDEVVINIVNYDMVEQMSLASTEYDKGVNEFIKSGLTPMESEKVKPPRVKESPASFECKVTQVIETGKDGGAGNLIICEVLLAHFQEKIFDKNGAIDPFKLDAVARMGGDWYCRAQGNAIFNLPKPNQNKGIGVDQIPEKIRNSHVLSANNLGRLGNIDKLPDSETVADFKEKPEIQEIYLRFSMDRESLENHLHLLAKDYLLKNELKNAWCALMLEI